MGKPEYEFFDPLTSAAHKWTPVAGDGSGGLEEMILSRDDGSDDHSRLLRFAPGTDTSPNGVLTHDTWEEVWVIQGELTDLRLGQTFTAGMYACRPPGMEHGPWRSDTGCMTFEVRYARLAGEVDAKDA